jgi:hypothetical protein
MKNKKKTAVISVDSKVTVQFDGTQQESCSCHLPTDARRVIIGFSDGTLVSVTSDSKVSVLSEGRGSMVQKENETVTIANVHDFEWVIAKEVPHAI